MAEIGDPYQTPVYRTRVIQNRIESLNHFDFSTYDYSNRMDLLVRIDYRVDITRRGIWSVVKGFDKFSVNADGYMCLRPIAEETLVP
jgi:hypothetical protein